jgi:ubiquinone/menaquinone biosynthesis C-methylase UbiE
MAANDRSFVGPIPEIYDRCLVPLLFEPYARDLAERVAATRPRSVLETAAGTGVLTRALAARLPAEARIAATDLNPAMLDHAKARQSSDDRITRQPADALALPFGDGGFDVVACQFGAMFFPDKVQGYREARRVLSPDRRFMFNVWDRISENDFAQAVTDALADRFPGDPPRFMARVPHGYFDLTQIREDLSRAGFATVTVEAVSFLSRATSAREAAIAFCQGTPLRGEIEARDASGPDNATQGVADVLARRFGGGAIEGRMRAFVFVARP